MSSPTAERARRADAQRNIAAILEAARECLVEDPDANVSEIAKRAGVGRVTLYGHFSSRAELVDAVYARTLEDSDHALEAVDLSGDPRAALDRLIASSWHIVDQFRSLLIAAQRSMPPERIRATHERPLRRISSLIARGRDEGSFRSDLPVEWMVALFHSVVHTAANEVNAGRLTDDDAPRMISTTLQAAFAPTGDM
ncbi:MAG TPA: TetR/AcrR family transcriptional regulator [Jiangellaceae bacterium]|nr:TetR/AcrR family transcriptional regulator [Jiangellaceae bacterium]